MLALQVRVTPLEEQEIGGSSGAPGQQSGQQQRQIWTHADITDRQEAARLLQLRNRALNSMSDGIFVADAAGGLMFANQGFERLTGYGQEAAAGQAWTFLLVRTVAHSLLEGHVGCHVTREAMLPCWMAQDRQGGMHCKQCMGCDHVQQGVGLLASCP